jgi:hypothetical protein
MRTKRQGDETDLGPNPPDVRREPGELTESSRSVKQPYASEHEDYTADHIKSPGERNEETAMTSRDKDMENERVRKIGERAYAIWLDQGQIDGRDKEHWRQAESEIVAEEEQESERRSPMVVIESAETFGT